MVASGYGLCDNTEYLSFWGIGYLPLILTPISVTITIIIAIWQQRHAYAVKQEALAAAHGRPTFFNHSATSLTSGRLVILPMYSWFFTFAAMAELLQGIVSLLIDSNILYGRTLPLDTIAAIVYGIQFFLYHLVNEGVIFSLLRPSAGTRSLTRAAIMTVIFSGIVGIWSAVAARLSSSRSHDMTLIVPLESLLFLFIATIAITPSKMLYRRPALMPFIRLSLAFRALKLTAICFKVGNIDIATVGCIEVGLNTLFSFLKPFMVFHTLKQDSDYWKGLLTSGNDEPHRHSIRQPLIGTSISAGTAGVLARELDGLPSLHYALLSLGSGEGESNNNTQLLGVGGQTRIYRGRYDGRPVAVKLLFCMELTPADVTSFASEANKMYQLRDHPNVIRLLGVCVRPPSMALIMEMATFGSLYHVLHPSSLSSSSSSSTPSKRSGDIASPTVSLPLSPSINTTTNYRIDSKSSTRMISSISIAASTPTPVSTSTSTTSNMVQANAPNIRLTHRNRLMMAMMCARGVAWMHAQRPPILHLDLKSHNFLVTAATHDEAIQWGGDAVPFVVKLCDLGLSVSSTELVERRHDDIQLPETINWTAPELFTGGDQQSAVAMLSTKSDCFALGMVMYEIATGEIPFENSRSVPSNSMIPRSATMMDIAMNDYRPIIPSYVDVRLAKLIQRLWATEPEHRPSAATAATLLADILGVPSSSLASDAGALSEAEKTEARFADFA